MQIVVITPVLYAMGADNEYMVAGLGGVQDASDLADKEIAEAGYLDTEEGRSRYIYFDSLIVMSNEHHVFDVLEKKTKCT